MNEENKPVLYLVAKRPCPDHVSTWRGSALIDMQMNAKAVAKIEKFRSERIFVKQASKRNIICSVMVDEITKNENGTFLVTFKDVLNDHFVLPGEITSFVGGFAEGRAPLKI